MAARMKAKNGPEIHPNHATGREAWRLVLALLPSEWTAQEPTQGDDYGIDAQLAIGRRGVMGPERPVLQVKGTRTSKLPTHVVIGRATVLRLVACTDFAGIVMVHLPSRGVWLVPVHDFRVARQVADHPDSERLRIPIHAEDRCDEHLSTWLDILSHRTWLIRQQSSPSALWIRLVGWDDTDRNRTELARLRQMLPSFLHVSRAPPDCPHLVQAELHGPPRFEVRDTARPRRPLLLAAPDCGSSFGALQLALGLNDIGLRGLSADILMAMLPEVKDAPVFDLGVAAVLAGGDVRGKRSKKVPRPLQVDLVTLLGMVATERGGRAALGVLINAQAYGATWVSQLLPHLHAWGLVERDMIGEVRRLFVEARKTATTASAVATSYLNEGYVLVQAGLVSEAIEAYTAAANARRDYLEHAHYWAFLGSSLFMASHLDGAKACYEVALRGDMLTPTLWQRALHILACAADWKAVGAALAARPTADEAGVHLYRLLFDFWDRQPLGTSEGLGALRRAVADSFVTTENEVRTPGAVEKVAVLVHHAPNHPLALEDASFYWAASCPEIAFCYSLTQSLITESDEFAWARTLALWLTIPEGSELRHVRTMCEVIQYPAALFGGAAVRRLGEIERLSEASFSALCAELDSKRGPSANADFFPVLLEAELTAPGPDALSTEGILLLAGTALPTRP